MPDPKEGWEPAEPSVRGLLEPHEVSRLAGKLEVLARPDPSPWHGVLKDLIEELNEIMAGLEGLIEPVS